MKNIKRLTAGLAAFMMVLGNASVMADAGAVLPVSAEEAASEDASGVSSAEERADADELTWDSKLYFDPDSGYISFDNVDESLFKPSGEDGKISPRYK